MPSGRLSINDRYILRSFLFIYPGHEGRETPSRGCDARFLIGLRQTHISHQWRNQLKNSEILLSHVSNRYHSGLSLARWPVRGRNIHKRRHLYKENSVFSLSEVTIANQFNTIPTHSQIPWCRVRWWKVRIFVPQGGFLDPFVNLLFHYLPFSTVKRNKYGVKNHETLQDIITGWRTGTGRSWNTKSNDNLYLRIYKKLICTVSSEKKNCQPCGAIGFIWAFVIVIPFQMKKLAVEFDSHNWYPDISHPPVFFSNIALSYALRFAMIYFSQKSPKINIPCWFSAVLLPERSKSRMSDRFRICSGCPSVTGVWQSKLHKCAPFGRPRTWTPKSVVTNICWLLGQCC